MNNIKYFETINLQETRSISDFLNGTTTPDNGFPTTMYTKQSYDFEFTFNEDDTTALDVSVTTSMFMYIKANKTSAVKTQIATGVLVSGGTDGKVLFTVDKDAILESIANFANVINQRIGALIFVEIIDADSFFTAEKKVELLSSEGEGAGSANPDANLMAYIPASSANWTIVNGTVPDDVAEALDEIAVSLSVDAKGNIISSDGTNNSQLTVGTNGQVLSANSAETTGLEWIASSAGEINTASNVGVGGISVFKQKTGVDLELNSINAGSSKITVALDAGNNEIDIDVAESNIDHGTIGGITDDDHTQYSLISSQAGAPATTPSRVGEINIDTTADTVYISTDTVSSADWDDVSTGGGSGEINTASNAGAGGIGVFDNKNVLDLEMRNIKSELSTLNVTLDAPDKEVHIDIDLTNPNTYTGQQGFATATLADGANISWNLDTQQSAKVTLAGNRTLDNPTNMVDGHTYVVRVIQDGTGTRTLAYGTAYKFPSGVAPVLSVGGGDIDLLTFISDGTNMYGTFSGDFS